jgi:hypothetical protein
VLNLLNPSKERMEENFNVFDFTLSDDDITKIAALRRPEWERRQEEMGFQHTNRIFHAKLEAAEMTQSISHL